MRLTRVRSRPLESDQRDCGSNCRRWYCAQAEYQKYALAIARLNMQGFVAFMPRCVERLPGRMPRLVPMFGSYFFVAFDKQRERWRAIASTAGVRRLFTTGDFTPIPVPVGVVEDLIHRGGPQGVIDEGEPDLVGQEIEVLSGPFAQFRGICTWRAGDRIKVLLDLFGRPTEASLRRYQVRA
jgi:hypothetical protein